MAAPLLHSAGRKPLAAFHYAATFHKKEIEWYSRFQLLVTGGILAPAVTSELLSAGCTPVAYEWTSAFYPGDPVSATSAWQQTVLANGDRWLLNRDPAGGGAAEPGRTAFWYDFADSGFRRARAAYLAERISINGYAGVFLDTPGFEQLPPLIQGRFQSRHAELQYNHCQGEFLKELRSAIGPSRIMFLNQGYRSAFDFLPCADYDLTESTFTFVSGGHTQFRKWHDAAHPWDSIRTPMERLIAPAAKAFPRVRFVHLNYAEGDSATVEQAIRYSLAAAKLWGHDSYLVTAKSGQEEHTAYFEELGKPITPAYQEDESSGMVWRDYEKARVVLANQGGSSGCGIARSSAGLDPAGCFITR